MEEGDKQINSLTFLFIITLFTGSVFLTSGEFVNATNTPKLYFAEVLLLYLLLLKKVIRDYLTFN
jgi:hypothetical protein